jgi:malonate transporter and related proteins
MSELIFFKLLAIFLVVALGWVAGQQRWLGPGRADTGAGSGAGAGAGADKSAGLSSGAVSGAVPTPSDPARVMANAAFFIFIPALLFRTTARIDMAALPWATLAAFFVPVLGVLVSIYGWQRMRGSRKDGCAEGSARSANANPAVPSVRAITATFGNTVQVGIPLSAALFGEKGLFIHIAIVSLHALGLLTVCTALVELDLARARALHSPADSHLGATLLGTVRNTVIHPVVLPVLAGLLWNAFGLPLPQVIDEVLLTLSQAVVPLCLVLIGLSLAYNGARSSIKGAVALCVLKLLVLPTVVLVVSHWGLGLNGLPLAVVVMVAALPVGTNALIFAQRYNSLQGEVTAAMVFSTLAFLLTAPLWLLVLNWLA